MADYSKEYEKLSFEDLQAKDKELATQRTEIRERQVAVASLLDAHRAMRQLNLPPETLKHMYRMSTVGAKSETGAAKS